MKITFGQLIGLLILIVVIAAAAFFASDRLKEGGSGKTRQAVFLTNGQVYFGYLSGFGSKIVTVKDIYYLQVQQPVQPADDKDNQNQQISLVKLGNELHGPKDEMKINRDHILFIEDMKDDSRVNQAISEFVKNGGQAPSPSPSPAS